MDSSSDAARPSPAPPSAGGDQPDAGSPAQRLDAIGRDLVEAVRDRTLEIIWRPVVRLADAKPLGHEALPRWNRRGTGYLPPDLLASLAGRFGVADAVDRWLLEGCCRAAASWPVPLWVSVALIGPWSARRDFPDRVAAILADAGLDPSRLRLGIAAAGPGGPDAGRIAAGLRSVGVGLVLDGPDPDPATGLGPGRGLGVPAAIVKLDRRATREAQADDGGPLAGVIARAHDRGMAVCAAGVEDAGQRDLLLRCGCDLGQGDLFGYPASVPMLRPGPRAA